MKLTPFVSAFILCITLFSSCSKDKESEEIKKEEDITFNKPHLNQNLKYGTLTDIDGNKYATIQIGSQTWMAENLKTSKYNDGTEILTGINNEGWVVAKTGIYAIYDNSQANNTLYGKLYNWYAVSTGKLCPKGWHVANLAEWELLKDYLGWSNPGRKLKSTSNLWNSPNTGATNSSGFSAIPAGRRISSGIYMMINENAFFWSSESISIEESYYAFVSYDYDGFVVGDYASTNKNDGNSCRCVKD